MKWHNFPISTLRSRFHYDPETGQFTHCVKGCRNFGSGAGSMNGKGYMRLWLNGTTIQAHRAAWAMAYGYWPKVQIDHINGDRTDNRLANLRLASGFQNACNRPAPKTNTSGFKGVTMHVKTGKWQAQIGADGRNHYLGLFTSPDEAAAAYSAAAKRLHGAFARTGAQERRVSA